MRLPFSRILATFCIVILSAPAVVLGATEEETSDRALLRGTSDLNAYSIKRDPPTQVGKRDPGARLPFPRAVNIERDVELEEAPADFFPSVGGFQTEPLSYTPVKEEFCESYAGIFRQDIPTEGRFQREVIGWANFLDAWGTYSNMGFRLSGLNVRVSLNGEQVFYSMTLEKANWGHKLVQYDSWAATVQAWKDFSRQGFRLYLLETFVFDDKVYYISVYRPGNQPYALYKHSNWKIFEDKWKDLTENKNLRLVDFETFVLDNDRWYVGVYLPGTSGHAFLAGRTWDEFLAKWEEFADVGLRLTDIEWYKHGNEFRWAGVWNEGDEGYALWAGVDRENMISKESQLRNDNDVHMVDVQVINTEQCPGDCCNHLVGTSYNYKITGDTMLYRWPVNSDGEIFFPAIYWTGTNPLFALPFGSDNVRQTSGWRYGESTPGDYHHALDYWVETNTTFQVNAAADGVVKYVGWDNWSGNTVVVEHDGGNWRSIYMHLRNGPSNDCNKALAQTLPQLSGTEKQEYQDYLTNSQCNSVNQDPAPMAVYWGTNAHVIPVSVNGTGTVNKGDMLAWAGNTGPGGKRSKANDDTSDDTIIWSSGANIHLHIFFAYKTGGKWYFVDPYGVYAHLGAQGASCYPEDVEGPLTGCSRYPVAFDTSGDGLLKLAT